MDKEHIDKVLGEILIAVEKRGGFSLDTQDKLPISETTSVSEATQAIKNIIEEERIRAKIEELNHLNVDEMPMGVGNKIVERRGQLEAELKAPPIPGKGKE